MVGSDRPIRVGISKRRYIMVRMAIMLMATLAYVSMAGCAAPPVSGKKFEYKNVQKIEDGKSTMADIRNLFGEPVSVRQTKTGEVWNYNYIGATFMGTKSFHLDVEFDTSGTVLMHKYSN